MSLYSKSVVAGAAGAVVIFLLMLLALYALSVSVPGMGSESGGMLIIILGYVGAILGAGLVGLVSARIVAKDTRGPGDTLIASVLSGITAITLLVAIVVLGFAIQGLGQSSLPNALAMLPWLILGGGYVLIMTVPFALMASVIGAMLYRFILSNIRVDDLAGIVSNVWFILSSLACGAAALGLPVVSYLLAPASKRRYSAPLRSPLSLAPSL